MNISAIGMFRHYEREVNDDVVLPWTCQSSEGNPSHGPSKASRKHVSGKGEAASRWHCSISGSLQLSDHDCKVGKLHIVVLETQILLLL